MKLASDVSDDEGAILLCFADFLENDGIEGLSEYLTHCRIKMVEGMTAGEAILAHYRTPLGYDINRAAMDLRTWPPIAARIFELQSEKAESRAKAKNRTNARSKAKRAQSAHALNGQGGHLPI